MNWPAFITLEAFITLAAFMRSRSVARKALEECLIQTAGRRHVRLSEGSARCSAAGASVLHRSSGFLARYSSSNALMETDSASVNTWYPRPYGQP